MSVAKTKCLIAMLKVSKNEISWNFGDALPSPKLGPRWALVFKTAKFWGFEGTLLALNNKRGRGVC
jgi:hypothetical protein